MASASSSHDDEFTDLLECRVCLGDLTDPRILPCHHSFCLRCLQEISRRSFRNSIKCPECRAFSTLPPEGIKGLKKDFIRNTIIDKVNKTKVVQKKSKYCDKHPDELLKLYCQIDNSIICYECRAYEHDDHKNSIIKIKEAAESKINATREGIASILETLDAIIKVKSNFANRPDANELDILQLSKVEYDSMMTHIKFLEDNDQYLELLETCLGLVNQISDVQKQWDQIKRQISSQSRNKTHSFSAGQSSNQGFSAGQSSNQGFSAGQSANQGFFGGQRPNHGFSAGQRPNHGFSTGQSADQGFSAGQSANHGFSTGQSANQGFSAGQRSNHGLSAGQSTNQGFFAGQRPNQGFSTGQSANQGFSTGQSANHGFSTGQSANQDFSTGQSANQGFGASQRSSLNTTQGVTQGYVANSSERQDTPGLINWQGMRSILSEIVQEATRHGREPQEKRPISLTDQRANRQQNTRRGQFKFSVQRIKRGQKARQNTRNRQRNCIRRSKFTGTNRGNTMPGQNAVSGQGAMHHQGTMSGQISNNIVGGQNMSNQNTSHNTSNLNIPSQGTTAEHTAFSNHQSHQNSASFKTNIKRIELHGSRLVNPNSLDVAIRDLVINDSRLVIVRWFIVEFYNTSNQQLINTINKQMLCATAVSDSCIAFTCGSCDKGVIHIYFHDGSHLRDITTDLGLLWGIGCNSEDEIVVCDWTTNSICHIDYDTGALLDKTTDPGLFRWPRYIAVANDDKVVVSDWWKNCITVVDRTGKKLMEYGTGGELYWPSGVCVADDNIIIVDSLNNRVSLVTPTVVHHLVTRDHGLVAPNAVTVNNRGNVLVGDIRGNLFEIDYKSLNH